MSETVPITVGDLELVVGPMFSGKSTELVRRLKRMQAAKKPYLSLVYSKDNRYFSEDEAVIGTHDQLSAPARKIPSLSDVPQADIDAVDTIVIDEGQFFASTLHYVPTWLYQGKNVIVAALNSTWQQQPFPGISQLYAIATRITHLTAICTMCGRDAPYSKKLCENGLIVEIGGAEKYTAVCGSCFML